MSAVIPVITSYLPYLCYGSTIYTVSVPIARMAMLECYPTLYATSASIISILLSILFSNFVTSFELWLLITLVTIVIAIVTYLVEIRGPVPSPVDMQGKVVLVTGANSGIGAETVRQLAEMGATVIMGCRSLNRSQPVCDEINQSVAQSSTLGGKAILLPNVSLDLCSLESVRGYAKAILQHYPAIDVLVCNAGLIPSGFSSHPEIVQGKAVEIENCFASNHLGHHLLIHLLLPALKLAKERRDASKQQPSVSTSSSAGPGVLAQPWPHGSPSRIVVVSSSIHKVASAEAGTQMTLDANKYQNMFVYGASKLSNMYTARHLAHLIKTDSALAEYKDVVHINTLHPGNPNSNVSSNLPFLLQTLEKLFLPLLMLYRETCSQGAYCSVWTATNMDALQGENQYYIHMQPGKQNPAVYDDASAKKLYDYCQHLCGLS